MASNVLPSSDNSIDALTATLRTLGLEQVPTLPNSYPALNPIDLYKAHITQSLSGIANVDPQVIYPVLQPPASIDKGDLTVPVPALKIKGKKPDELAKQLAEQFPASPLVEKPVVSGTFLAFFFKPQPLAQLALPIISNRGSSYGFNPVHGLRDVQDPSKGKKKIIIEFSSPNIAKDFHAGHLRSTIIGGFLSHLYERAGWDVVRMNYLGDWGKQYGLLAVGFQQFGSEEALQQKAIGHLFDVYVKISAIQHDEKQAIEAMKQKIKQDKESGASVADDEAELQKMMDNSVDEQARKYFKRMCDGDPVAIGLWSKFRNLSIEKYKKTYARLNIHFDEYSGESQVQDESMEAAAKMMADSKVSEESEGAIIVDLTKYSKKLGKAVVRKKDGTTLYLTRDLGAGMERFDKYHFDKMIYVVAAAQDLHLAQLFKIEELMGRKDISERCEHINFGNVLGMSTRKGTAKFLDDILRDVGDKMHEVMRTNEKKYAMVEDPEKVADTLGISAVMVQDMSGRRINNYHFDMNRMTSFEGDTGPYLQYAHARLCSIARNADVPLSELTSADLSLLQERHATLLIRSLAQWPDVVSQTMRTLEPVTVLTYLFRMTHLVSSSYDHLQVVGSEPELKKARMLLYTCARQVLDNGMRLLGLSPVERM